MSKTLLQHCFYKLESASLPLISSLCKRHTYTEQVFGVMQEELEARAAAAAAGNVRTQQPSIARSMSEAYHEDEPLGLGDAYVGSSKEDALQPLVASIEHWPLKV
jgi:hypothetical protein